MTDPRSFGAWLQRERERRGITLRSIADRTKIGAALLQGLERGDLSRWPGGIYRRAFVRGYAEAVGLDADLVLANFECVFPSDPDAPASAARSVLEQPEMRLALVTPLAGGLTVSAMKAAGRDLACMLACALAGLAIGGAVGFWSTAAVVAIAFHVSRLLGLDYTAVWRRFAEHRRVDTDTRAEIVSFTLEQERSPSRRARARHVLADLSAAATSAVTRGPRRAARS
jgi:cytoskeletal protein RodZ